jgi:hypothetical protein
MTFTFVMPRYEASNSVSGMYISYRVQVPNTLYSREY